MIQTFSKGFVFAFEGAQDTGKTFSTVFLAYMISQYKWYRLKKDYYKFKNIENELRKKKGKLDRITYQIYKAKETAYLYFRSNEKKYIPCLISNNTVYEKKTNRESYPFDIKLLQMLKRVPESCVFILDEVAEDLPNTIRLFDTEKVKGKTEEQIESEKNAKAINSFLSMARQFADATLFINDQRLMEVFIGVRSVCQIRRSLKDKNEVLKPNAVLKIMNYAEKRIDSPTGKQKYVKIYERFEKIYKSIGYLKIVYVEQYGYDDTFKNEKNEYVMYLSKTFR